MNFLNKMEPSYLVYDLKESFNKELFLKRAEKAGFNLRGRLVFSPEKGLPREDCACLMRKEDVYAQGIIYGYKIYIAPNENRTFPELKEFLDEFELE